MSKTARIARIERIERKLNERSTRKLSLSIIQQDAKRRGGKCLDTEYVSARSFMTFKCKNRHVFTARVSDFRAGCWCSLCGNKRKGWTLKPSIKVLRTFAKKNGGKLISKQYENGLSPLLWECSVGHMTTASWNNIRRRRRDHFCLKCARGIK